MPKGERFAPFEGRAISEHGWRRILDYPARSESMHTPTPEEVAKLNADFDALHQGMDPDMDPE